MNMMYLRSYIKFFVSIIIFDQIIKALIITFLHRSVYITSFLSCELVINRGIAFGLFNSLDTSLFLTVTGIVMGVYGFFAYAVIKNALYKQSILGEILVLSGGFSNLIDRVLYKGVIDFIHISYKSWSFPVFNVADAVIVLGVGLIIYSMVFSDGYRKKYCVPH